MALLPKEQAAIDDARKRGLSQQKINTFLSENPNDYSRLYQQQPDDPGKGSMPSQLTGAGMQVGGNMAPPTAPGTPASVQALNTAAGTPAEAPGSLPMFTPQEPAGPGVMGTASGMLRQGMGMRQPPMPNMALAALKRIY